MMLNKNERHRDIIFFMLQCSYTSISSSYDYDNRKKEVESVVKYKQFNTIQYNNTIAFYY